MVEPIEKVRKQITLVADKIAELKRHVKITETQDYKEYREGQDEVNKLQAKAKQVDDKINDTLMGMEINKVNLIKRYGEETVYKLGIPKGMRMPKVKVKKKN